MNRILKQVNTVPIALLIFTLLGFGLLIPWLGYYWDDWPSIWFLHRLGPAGFGQVFSEDRPLLGLFFTLSTSVFGEHAILWQLFGLFTRWLTVLAFWWFLRGLWPERGREVSWTAFLLLIYPGFKQQYISVTYSNAWIILMAFFLSLGMMAWAFRRPRWFWPLMLGSWLFSVLSLFTSEYYFGLELLRPVLLWMLLAEKNLPSRQRLRQAVIQWLPFLAILAAFLLWRIVLHATPRGQVQILEELGTSPTNTGLRLGLTILQDILEGSLMAWAQVFNFPALLSLGTVPSLFYAAVTVISILLAVAYFWRFLAVEPTSTPPVSGEGSGSREIHEAKTRISIDPQQWGRQAAGIGLLALLVSGIPFWVTELPIELRFPWDRFTLAMMPGASLLLAGLVAWLIRPLWARVLLLGLLVGLATGMHAQNANSYRREWASQRLFFWQLTWRVPGLEPGTLLLTSEMPFLYFSDFALSAPLNWTYAPDDQSTQMPYMLYRVESRLGGRLKALTSGQSVEQPYRVNFFRGSTDQAVVLFFTPPGCVKIVDPVVDARLLQKPNYIAKMLPLSNLKLIRPDANPPARPPESVLGPEPDHGWCYYFEKADLARQQGDWQSVVTLGDQAFQLGASFYEANVAELVPFIEGYAHQGQWQRAQDLSVQAHQVSFRVDRMVCATWQRIAADTPPNPEQQAAIQKMQDKLNCSKN